jgi:hypothetical protein
MGDPDTKRKASRKRQRNFLAKKVLSERQFSKRIHEDEKKKQKERKWQYDKETDDSFS